MYSIPCHHPSLLGVRWSRVDQAVDVGLGLDDIDSAPPGRKDVGHHGSAMCLSARIAIAGGDDRPTVSAGSIRGEVMNST